MRIFSLVLLMIYHSDKFGFLTITTHFTLAGKYNLFKFCSDKFKCVVGSISETFVFVWEISVSFMSLIYFGDMVFEGGM